MLLSLQAKPDWASEFWSCGCSVEVVLVDRSDDEEEPDNGQIDPTVSFHQLGEPQS
jgi:hypothetical protein